MVTQPEALKIACRAIAHAVDRSRGGPVRIDVEPGRYVVTFNRSDPPGFRGPDYDARVVIDAATGEVLEVLVAS
jgi:hypothetical protein